MSDTSRGLFPVVRIDPATRQALPGGEYQIGFREPRRIRHFFTSVKPAFGRALKGIKKRLQLQNLDQIVAWSMSEKHVPPKFMIHGLAVIIQRNCASIALRRH
ncbi:MAG: hypothetical protein AAB134_08455 [Pseudomonadota bacterium]